MSKQMLVPDANHPITIAPTAERVVVRRGDVVIADTTSALTLRESTYPAVQYVPLRDVAAALLSATETHTYCPFKGEASYYSLRLPTDETTGEPTDDPADDTLVDAVWAYVAPYPAVAAIAGHVAFYPNSVEVTVG